MKTRTFVLILILVLTSCQLVQAQNNSEEKSKVLDDLNKELDLAAETGDVDKVKALISSGADVNSRHDLSHTPIMVAAYYGHYEVVKVLIEAGADVNAAHSINHTVLYHALESPRLRAESIKLLVDAGVNMDYTPLTWAVRYLSIYRNTEAQEIMAMLIKAGADVNERDQLGIPVLVTAACGGSNQLVDILLRSGAEINATVELSGRTALVCAVMWKHTETVKLLIEAGADLEIADKLGNTPLMTAKSKDSEEIVELLKEAGAVK